VKNKFSAGIVSGVVLATLALGMIAAKPNGCPPGIGGQCKQVQHKNDGKVGCLPVWAINEKVWTILGVCPGWDKPEPTAKPTKTPNPTATLMAPTPTAPIRFTEVPPTQEPPATDEPPGLVVVSPTCTPTLLGFVVPETGIECDICTELQRQADALERIANAQETQAARP